MKFKKLLSLAVGTLLCVSLVGCSSSKEEKTIKVGATLVPGGELLRELEGMIEEKGYELEIVEFDDYILPNESLNNGEIDANLFQHKPFLEKTNEEKGCDLVAVEPLYVCPITLYSDKSI